MTVRALYHVTALATIQLAVEKDCHRLSAGQAMRLPQDRWSRTKVEGQAGEYQFAYSTDSRQIFSTADS